MNRFGIYIFGILDVLKRVVKRVFTSWQSLQTIEMSREESNLKNGFFLNSNGQGTCLFGGILRMSSPARVAGGSWPRFFQKSILPCVQPRVLATSRNGCSYEDCTIRRRSRICESLVRFNAVLIFAIEPMKNHLFITWLANREYKTWMSLAIIGLNNNFFLNLPYLRN